MRFGILSLGVLFLFLSGVIVSGVCAENLIQGQPAPIMTEDPAQPDPTITLVDFHPAGEKSLARSEIDFVELGSTLWDRPHYGQISGDFLYACFPHGLVIYDISDSIHITEYSRIPIDGANDVEINGNYAYIGCGHDNTSNQYISALRIVDISDPAEPLLVNEYPTLERVRDYPLRATDCIWPPPGKR